MKISKQNKTNKQNLKITIKINHLLNKTVTEKANNSLNKEKFRRE